jgi:hypothetical protein
MSKHVKIERIVDPGMDGNDIEIEKRGEDTYRVRTGSDSEFDFRNRNKREAFRAKFASVYNDAVGGDSEDRFTLDPTEHKTRERFRKFERGLEEGRDSFDFRVRD